MSQDIIVTENTLIQVVETSTEHVIIVSTTEEESHVIETTENDVLVVSSEADVQIIEVSTAPEAAHVIETESDATAIVLTVGEQGPMGIMGPPGPPGSGGEEDVPYAKKIDFVSDSIIYTGRAAVGASASAPAWQIFRTTMASDDDVSIEWAEGDADFDKIWNNRLTYSYS